MRLSERIYQILLKAYPARYLRRYREPMVQLFSDQLRRASGAGSFVSLWLRTLADLLRTVPAPDPPLRMFLNPRSQSARAQSFQSPGSVAYPRIRGSSRDFRSVL